MIDVFENNIFLYVGWYLGAEKYPTADFTKMKFIAHDIDDIHQSSMKAKKQTSCVI
jgi:hypothetical protein